MKRLLKIISGKNICLKLNPLFRLTNERKYNKINRSRLYGSGNVLVYEESPGIAEQDN